MAKSSKAKSALPYLQRVLEDEYVQEQLRDAAVGLRKAYSRATKKRVQATDDRKLYGSLRRAATSIRNAIMALRKPEPPPKRRGRKLLIITLAAGGAALLTRLCRQKHDSGTSTGVDDSSGATAPGGTDSVQPEPVARSS
jgi:hypothetical protein